MSQCWANFHLNELEVTIRSARVIREDVSSISSIVVSVQVISSTFCITDMAELEVMAVATIVLVTATPKIRVPPTASIQLRAVILITGIIVSIVGAELFANIVSKINT